VADLALRTVDGWAVWCDAEDEAWVRDLDIAERAELKVPRDVRRTIAKLIEERTLIIVGGAHDDKNGAFVRVQRAFVETGKGAQREVDEYLLNEEAALHVLMLLRTPRAIEVRRQVVHVFMLVRRGRLTGQSAADALFQRLGDLLERHEETSARLTEGFLDVKAEVAEVRVELTELRSAVDQVRAALPKRRKPTESAKSELVRTTRELGGNCPCCRRARMFGDDDAPTRFAEFDHHRSVDNPSIDAMWWICKPCHNALTSGSTKRNDVEIQFGAFHAARTALPGAQGDLFGGKGGKKNGGGQHG